MNATLAIVIYGLLCIFVSFFVGYYCGKLDKHLTPKEE